MFLTKSKWRLRATVSRFALMADDGGTGGGGSGGEASGGAPAKVSTNAGEGTSAAAKVDTTVGGAAKVSQEGTSASASVPAGVGTETVEKTGDFRQGWDETLTKDPLLSGFKDTASMAKALLETKKLVGQKLGIPGADATPEAKNAFFEALGVPKDGEGYGFKKPDNLPEGMPYDEKDAAEWAGFFKENNIPAAAGNAIRDRFMKTVLAQYEGAKGAADKSDTQFMELAVKIHGGDQKKTETSLQNARTLMEKHLPPELKGALGELPNAALLAIAATVNAEVKALTGEDRTISRDGGDNAGGQSKEQLRAEARRLQALPEYGSPFTTKGKEAHQKVVDEVKGLYARIGKMA